jgi:hypothetical protein
LDEALVQLATAARGGDVKAAASAAERALFTSIEKGTGLKARGILKANLASALTEAGVPPELADRASQLLGRCDELRFAGEAADLSSFAREVRDTSQTLGRRA